MVWQSAWREYFSGNPEEVGALYSLCLYKTHTVAERFCTFGASERDRLLHFSLKLPQPSLRKVVCIVDLRMTEEQEMVIPVFRHPELEVPPIRIVLIRWMFPVFSVTDAEDLIIAYFVG